MQDPSDGVHTELISNLTTAKLRKPFLSLALLMTVVAFAFLPVHPLYFDNQNTKFLYGLAKAGVGRLSDDWLVAQGSPLPIFDAFVFWTYKISGKWGFYVWLLAAFTTYTITSAGIAWFVGVTKPNVFGARAQWFVPIFGVCWIGLNGNTGMLKTFEGIAGQYINGPVLETQTVGVLCFLGLFLFRLNKSGWSVFLIVTAAWMHPAFALSGLILLFGMVHARWRFGVHLPLPTIFAGLLGCCAAAAFELSLLQPSDRMIQIEAARIITEERIPWHSWPRNWADDSDTYLKLLAVFAASWITRRDPLSSVILMSLLAIIVLAGWVAATHDVQLALAAPWRVSSIVVPLANSILLGRLMQVVAIWSRDAVRRRAVVAGTVAFVVVITTSLGQVQRYNSIRRDAQPVYYEWVRAQAQEGDLFLTGTSERNFRLATGQPQYVTWKTHPYRATSVIEWRKRLERAAVLTGPQPPSCDVLNAVAMEGVTHLVRDSATGAAVCPEWDTVYDDGTNVISARHP